MERPHLAAAGAGEALGRTAEITAQSRLLGDELSLAERRPAGLGDTAARGAVSLAEALSGDELGRGPLAHILAPGQRRVHRTRGGIGRAHRSGDGRSGGGGGGRSGGGGGGLGRRCRAGTGEVTAPPCLLRDELSLAERHATGLGNAAARGAVGFAEALPRDKL